MDQPPHADRDSAIDRAAELLVAIAGDHGATPLRTHATRLGIPLSTAYRMVGIFTRRGLLAQGRRGHFGPGLTLSAIGHAAQPRTILTDVARAPLRRLARQIRGTAHLGIIENDMVTYIVKEHRGGPTLFTREGDQLEAYCSAIGKILLAALPDERLDDYLGAAPFVALTPKTVADPIAIRQELLRVRQRGFAIDDGEIAEGLFCVAVPIRQPDGAVVAATSLSRQAFAPIGASPPDALLDCARAIETRLGSRC